MRHAMSPPRRNLRWVLVRWVAFHRPSTRAGRSLRRCSVTPRRVVLATGLLAVGLARGWWWWYRRSIRTVAATLLLDGGNGGVGTRHIDFCECLQKAAVPLRHRLLVDVEDLGDLVGAPRDTLVLADVVQAVRYQSDAIVCTEHAVVRRALVEIVGFVHDHLGNPVRSALVSQCTQRIVDIPILGVEAVPLLIPSSVAHFHALARARAYDRTVHLATLTGGSASATRRVHRCAAVLHPVVPPLRGHVNERSAHVATQSARQMAVGVAPRVRLTLHTPCLASFLKGGFAHRLGVEAYVAVACVSTVVFAL